jgi:hypothetical protein
VRENAANREDDVVGGERRAVMEGDSGTEMETPCPVVGVLPPDGERRLQGHVPVEPEHRVEDVHRDDVVDDLELPVRIEGGDVVGLDD